MQLSLCELLYWLELVADQALAALWEVERRIGKDEAAFKSVELYSLTLPKSVLLFGI